MPATAKTSFFFITAIDHPVWYKLLKWYTICKVAIILYVIPHSSSGWTKWHWQINNTKTNSRGATTNLWYSLSFCKGILPAPFIEHLK
jgi:hypothetical protein